MRIPYFRRLSGAFLVLGVWCGEASAASGGGGWNASVAYNNPPGSSLGVNVCHVWSNFAIEIGLGSIGVNSNRDASSGSLGGDIDLKYYFGSSWRPYLEAGLGLGVGAGVGKGGGAGIAAAGPFAGLGIAYHGSKMIFYVGADAESATHIMAPAIGVGVKL